MEQYTITGMSCAACATHIEKAVSEVPGVTSCVVSLLTNSMSVEGSADSADIIRAVADAGYGASLRGSGEEKEENGKNPSVIEEQEKALEDRETPKLRRRLILSIGFLLVLMYVAMGYTMFEWPMPAWFEGNPIATGLVEMLLSAVVMLINYQFFVSGFRSFIHGAPNMDTLVSLGSMASFVWGIYTLFLMTGAVSVGNMGAAMNYMHEFYFDSAAMILTLITVGKLLEAYSKGRTTDALKSLMKLAPKTAVLEKDGAEETVPVSQIKKGDIFLVRPGENIPVDGVILDGESAVNEAALTGESVPADKTAGDPVSAATINQSGFLRCEATRVGEDTTLSQIIKMVSDAAATKAPIEKIADRVAGVFVPVVMVISVLTLIIWLIAGQTAAFALARGISVLVISCPCALGLATPVAIMVGNGLGAKNGILFKTAESLEETGRSEIVVLDKTGTITRGEPKVTDLIPAEGATQAELINAALALEKKSEHPFAKAILSYGEEKNLAVEEVTGFQSLPGNGLTAVLDGEELLGGSLTYIEGQTLISRELEEQAQELAENGKTPLLFTKGGKLLGIIAVADVIKEDSPLAVKELQGMGIRVVMLTGDNERTAKAIGDQVGVDQVIAGVLPDEKEKTIRRLKELGKVAMVGDGINDAPALTTADIGIAIGAGTDVAIDAADVVLMKSRLSDVPAAIRLSRATLRNIHENLFWAFFYNVICIPLAAGVWIPIFGWTLNPMICAAAMSLSSFCVVSNALRLNFTRLRDSSRDKKREPVNLNPGGTEEEKVQEEPQKDKKKELSMDMKEEPGMVKTVIQVEGMMCEMCEKHVNEAIEKNFEVEEVKSSREEKLTEVLSREPLNEEKLKDAITEAGYQPGKITVREV